MAGPSRRRRALGSEHATERRAAIATATTAAAPERAERRQSDGRATERVGRRMRHEARHGGILICEACATGVPPGPAVRRHLLEHHRDWPLAERRAIGALAAGLGGGERERERERARGRETGRESAREREPGRDGERERERARERERERARERESERERAGRRERERARERESARKRERARERESKDLCHEGTAPLPILGRFRQLAQRIGNGRVRTLDATCIML
jgi:hypothetical protein